MRRGEASRVSVPTQSVVCVKQSGALLSDSRRTMGSPLPLIWGLLNCVAHHRGEGLNRLLDMLAFDAIVRHEAYAP